MAGIKALHLCSTTFEPPYFENLSQGLAARGVTLLLGSLSEPQPPSWLSEIPGARYHYFNAPKRSKYPIALWEIMQLLRQERVDVIQTHLFDAGILGLLAARLARTPVKIVARHHMDEPQLLGKRSHVEMDRWISRAADCVVVPSRAVQDYIYSQERHKNDNVIVIPYGFNFDSLDATDEDRSKVRAEFGLQSKFLLGCVGRFFKNKGHVYLFEALMELINEIPEIHLLLLGSGDKSRLEKIIGECGLEKFVTFAGYRRDVPACMKAMDLFVHPSLSESFGQVVVEAMNVGTAVVAAGVGGVPEIVTDHQTGLLVPPGNANAISHAVLELYRDSELRRGLAQAGQKSVRERFSVDQMVTKQLNSYQRFLKKNSSANHNHVGS
jgi:glycosyltransferase involved in cell wall biosynthesis